MKTLHINLLILPYALSTMPHITILHITTPRIPPYSSYHYTLHITIIIYPYHYTSGIAITIPSHITASHITTPLIPLHPSYIAHITIPHITTYPSYHHFTSLYPLISPYLSYYYTLYILLILLYPYHHSRVLIYVLYGVRWSETNAPTVLSVFCIYVWFMAINGVCEAFFFATISNRRISEYNTWLFMFSIAYVCISWFLVVYGTLGLVIANMLIMCLRITYCLIYIHQFFREGTQFSREKGTTFSLFSCFPSPMVLLICTTSAIVTLLSYQTLDIGSCHGLRCFVMHILVGCVCLLFTLITIGYYEHSLFQYIRRRKHD